VKIAPIAGALAAVIAMTSMPARAQEAAPFARAVIFNADNAMQQYYGFVDLMASLENFKRTKQTEIDGKVTEYQDLQKQTQAKAASMTEATRQQALTDLQRRETEIRRLREDAEREASTRLSTALQEAQKVMEPALKAETESRQADLVIMQGPARDNILVYGDRLPDVTLAVAARLNAPCAANAGCRQQHANLPGMGN